LLITERVEGGAKEVVREKDSDLVGGFEELSVK
jgi:hypothetical protein